MMTISDRPETQQAIIERALGVSRLEAGRLARIGRNLTTDQVSTVRATAADREVLDRVAALRDAGRIDRCVKLLGAGLNPDHALRLATV
jgi:hypothetical protein